MSVPLQPGLEAAIGSLTQTSNSTAPVSKTFTESEVADALAKVRKEEKDKLYSEISSLKDQFSKIQQSAVDAQKERDDAAAEAQRIQREKDEAIRLKQEEELSAKQLLDQRLKETNDSWESRFTQLQQERDNEKALMNKEREYNELVDYRNKRLNELANDIAPEFHDFVTGNTVEQIDAAIERAKVGTQSIWNQVQQVTKQTTPRGVSPTGYSAFGPLDNAAGTQTFTAEDINNMTMAEYNEFRTKNGMASRDASRNRGLFS